MSRRIADDPKLLYWEIKCADKIFYCADNILMEASHLTKDITEEFGETFNILEIPLFSSDIIIFLLTEYNSFTGDFSNRSPQEIIQFIECMRYLQFDNSIVIRYIEEFLNSYEMEFEFFYYYYQHTYCDIPIDYPGFCYSILPKVSKEHLLGFLDKITEILNNYDKVQTFYDNIRNKIEYNLTNNGFKINLEEFTTVPPMGTNYKQPYQCFNNIVRKWLIKNFGCSKQSWDNARFKIVQHFRGSFNKVIYRLGSGDDEAIDQSLRMWFNLPTD